MLTLVCCLAIAFTDDYISTWSEALNPLDIAVPLNEQTSIYVDSEITIGHTMPAGRVEGTRAYVYWPERVVESPLLTCIDLPTGELIWQIPVSPKTAQILFTRQHVIVCERSDLPNESWSLRWFDSASANLGHEMTFDERGWFRLCDRQWLVFSNGEIRQAETGNLIATTAIHPAWDGLTVNGQFVALETDYLADEPRVWLNRIDLATGKALTHYRVGGKTVQHHSMVYAADEESVVLHLLKWEGAGRTLLRVSTVTDAIHWQTELPVHAPVHLTNLPISCAIRHNPGGNIALAASVDVDWIDGTLRYPPDRPSPVSRFDWHVPSRSEALGLRMIDGSLVGWMRIDGDDAQVMGVEPHTGQLQWKVPISHPSLAARWLFEMSSEPQFGVFPFGDEIRTVNLRTGKASSFSVTGLGLKKAIDFPPPASTPDQAETRPHLSQPPGRQAITGLTFIAVFGWLLGNFLRRSKARAPSMKSVGL